MIMFGSFLPSLLVGFSTTNFTRAGEPTLSWNQLRSLTFEGGERQSDYDNQAAFQPSLCVLH
jgi:hypothetical protein